MKGATAKQLIHLRLVIVVAALLLMVVGPLTYLRARADHLGLRELKLSTTAVSASSSYSLSFTNITAGTLGSVQVQFCSNDPYPGYPCTAPNGFNVLTSTLGSQTGVSGYVINPSSTANNLILSGTPAAVGPIPISFTLNGVTNPSDLASYYVRLQTFASNNGTGVAIDSGGLAFVINANSVAINAEVPPYLLFCGGVVINDNFCNSVTGNYINFGNLSPTHTSSAQTELLAATNGGFGYSITLSGSSMTSGNNVISPLIFNDVARPGVSQFGLNLRANSSPAVGSDPIGPGVGQPTPNYNIPDRFRFNNGEVIAGSASPEDIHKFTVSYIVDISNGQAIGVYATTINYICLANF
jgi:hypothetical protein